MQRDTERDLILAWQDGSLSAARQLVSLLQAEAVNVAFLLTGTQQGALALAETTFLTLLERARSGDLDIDRRVQLLTMIGQSFLRGDYIEHIEEIPAGLPTQSPALRFNVDNRRTLILAALGRLDDRERTALVLRDFSDLDVSEMTRLLERRNDPLVAPMDTARQRVRQSLDLPAGEHLRRTLAEATFDAPRIDLWQRLEDPVTELQTRKRNQSRIMTFGILAAIVLVLLGTLVALFREDLFGSGEANGSASGMQAVDDPTAEVIAVATVEPVEPTPTTAATPFPAANLPDWLLLNTWTQAPGEAAIRSLEIFDAIEGEREQLPTNSPLKLTMGADQVRFSPDGHQMVVFREELIEQEIHYFLTSFSTGSVGRQWETPLLTVPATPEIIGGSHVPVRFAAAITDDRVYTGTLTTESTATLTIDAFFTRNGMPRGSIDLTLPRQNIDNRVFRGGIYLHAPQNSDRLYAIVESFGDAVEHWRATILIIDRNDMTLLGERNASADRNQGFWLWASHLTSNGTALYGLSQPGGVQPQMQFLDLESGEITSLDLPFAVAANRGGAPMTSTLSHDGQRLYILHWEGANVAIVNLVSQRIERVFPLDLRGYEEHVNAGGNSQIYGYGAILSPDGSELYLTTWERDDSSGVAGNSGLWVIDTARWNINGYVPLDGFATEVFLSPAEDAVYVQVWPQMTSNSYNTLARIDVGDQPQLTDIIDIPLEDNNDVVLQSPAQLYRLQFGHSPAIDSVELTDNGTISTLPRVEVTSSPSTIAAGNTATIEVRVVDPSNGTPITAARDDLRYDPNGGVTALVYAEDGQSQIVILGEAEPGVFRGGALLPTEGTWSVDVNLIDDQGAPWTVEGAVEITVVPTFTGDDGRVYMFQVSTEPANPVVEDRTVVHLKLIDAQTGAPVPEDVSVSISGNDFDLGASEELHQLVEVTFSHYDAAYSSTSVSLVQHGVYEGTTSFWAPGTWTSTIRLRSGSDSQAILPGNSVIVVRE